MKIKIIFVMQVILLTVLYASPLKTSINVLPDTTAIVGEEIYFDARESTYDSNTIQGRFEWDFGDGYQLKKGDDVDLEYNGGISCSHCFMKPGIYNVKMVLSDDINNLKDSCFKNITVTGIAPIAGFELMHANFHNRLALPIYALIPANYTNKADVRLQAYIINPTGIKSTILAPKSNLRPIEHFLLQTVNLPAGTSLFSVELLDGANQQISILTEKIVKLTSGIPRIGIDENNAICIDGKPFFPIAPFLLNKGDFPEWIGKGYANSVYGIGYYPDGYTISDWNDYLKFSQQSNCMAIGPSFWVEQGPDHFVRNSDVRSMEQYIIQCKNNKALLFWDWFDEPNNGAESQYVPAYVLRSWTYKSHLLDPDHLVSTNFSGYDYLNEVFPDDGFAYGNWRIKKYHPFGDSNTPKGNGNEFGGKRICPTDVIGFDIYPIEYSKSEGLNSPKRGPMDLYAQAMDNMNNWNYNLTPAFSFIETNDIHGSGNPSPTASQFNMEIWLNVIHGMKGIFWFQAFNETPPGNYSVMAKFLDQITRLTPIVLGPKSNFSVANNANIPGRRVDFLVKETTAELYIFAVRVTEPSWQMVAANEPESISVAFTLNGIKKDQSFQVFDEARTLQFTNSMFSDVFKKEDVHIYVLKKDNGAVRFQQVHRNPACLKLVNGGNNILFTGGGGKGIWLDILTLQGKKIGRVYIYKNIITPLPRTSSSVVIIKAESLGFNNIKLCRIMPRE